MNACARWNSPERARCERSPEIATTSNRAFLDDRLDRFDLRRYGWATEMQVRDVEHRHHRSAARQASRAMMASVNCAGARGAAQVARHASSARGSRSPSRRECGARARVARVLEHQARREHERARVRDALARDVRRGAVHRLEDRAVRRRCSRLARARARRRARRSESERMSPNRFVVTITSNVSGLITSCIAIASTMRSSNSTRPAYSFATCGPTSRGTGLRASSGCSPCGRASLSCDRARPRTRTRSG